MEKETSTSQCHLCRVGSEQMANVSSQLVGWDWVCPPYLWVVPSASGAIWWGHAFISVQWRAQCRQVQIFLSQPHPTWQGNAINIIINRELLAMPQHFIALIKAASNSDVLRPADYIQNWDVLSCLWNSLQLRNSDWLKSAGFIRTIKAVTCSERQRKLLDGNAIKPIQVLPWKEQVLGLLDPLSKEGSSTVMV